MTSNCVKQIEILHNVWQPWRVQMQGALWGDRHLAQSYVHLLFGECTACGKSDSFCMFSLTPGTGNMRPDGSSSSSSLSFRGVKRLQMSVWPSWVLHSQILHRVVVVLPPWPPCCYSYTPGQLVFLYFSAFVLLYRRGPICLYFQGRCLTVWSNSPRRPVLDIRRGHEKTYVHHCC